MTDTPPSGASAGRAETGAAARLATIARWLDEALDALLTWGAASSWRGALVVALVALAVTLPGLTTLPVTDRDEARFVQATKQMLETGDLIDIRFQDEPRWKKPVGIYWLQAAAASAFGGTDAPIWAYRLPSALAVILGALATLWAARPLVGPRAAVLAGMALPTALLAAAEANIAKTDATLMLTAVIVLGTLGRALNGRAAASTWLAFWLAMAAAILIKGPVIPVIAALAVIVVWLVTLRRPRLSSLRPGRGILLTLGLVAPWLVAIWVVSEGRFFAESVGEDLIAKVKSGQEAHGAPPGLYLVLVWLTFWPWAAFLPAAARRLWSARREAWAVVLIGWAVPFWIVLEAVPTKLPHYVLPLYPALAIAVAAVVVRARRTGDAGDDGDAPARTSLASGAEADRGASPAAADSADGDGAADAAGGALAPGTTPGRWAGRAAALAMALPPVVLGLAVIVLPLALEGIFLWQAALLGIIGALMGLVAAAAARRGLRLGQAAAGILAALALYPAILHVALPAMATAFPSPRMAAIAAQWRPCASGSLMSLGYREPSLVFLTETATLLGPPDAIAARLAADPGAMVLVEDRWRPALDQLLGPDAPRLIERAALGYFNYNRGKPETARLLTRDDPRWNACARPQ